MQRPKPKPGITVWYCEYHQAYVIGTPLWLRAKDPYAWELDQSDMMCQALADDEFWDSMTPDEQDAEMDKCDWQEITG